MSRPSTLALAALALAACESAQEPQAWADFRLGSAHVWSGGEVALVSAAFAAATLPTVTLGDSALSVRRVNDSTVAARLPDGSGPYALRVEFAGLVPVDTPVTLHGFTGAEVGPFLSGFVQALAPQPWVLGAGDSGLVEVDVRASAVLRHWPDTVHSPDCVQSVGPSVRPGHFVFFGKDPGGACRHPWVWQYGASLTRVDSLFGVVDHWGIAEIGPGGTIQGGDDFLTLPRCDSTGCTQQAYFNMAGALTGVTIGRTASRAILHSWFGWLVDAASGDTLRRMSWHLGAPFHHVEGAAFTPAEDTVYVIMSQGAGSSRLFLIEPVSGMLLDTLTLPGVTAFDVARDPVRPWLYIFALAGSPSGIPQVIVLQQGTLAPVAVLRAPAAEALSTTQWHQFRLVQDAPLHALYVVATVQTYRVHGTHARILRFDLVP